MTFRKVHEAISMTSCNFYQVTLSVLGFVPSSNTITCIRKELLNFSVYSFFLLAYAKLLVRAQRVFNLMKKPMTENYYLFFSEKKGELNLKF